MWSHFALKSRRRSFNLLFCSFNWAQMNKSTSQPKSIFACKLAKTIDWLFHLCSLHHRPPDWVNSHFDAHVVYFTETHGGCEKQLRGRFSWFVVWYCAGLCCCCCCCPFCPCARCQDVVYNSLGCQHASAPALRLMARWSAPEYRGAPQVCSGVVIRVMQQSK